MSANIPSTFATIAVSYGEKNGHLYAPDKENFRFHENKAEAVEVLKQDIRDGCRMVALLKVEALYKVKKIEFEEIV